MGDSQPEIVSVTVEIPSSVEGDCLGRAACGWRSEKPTA